MRTPNSPFGNDPFFRYFFGDDDEVFGSRDRRSLSLGSGVIISADGYVVTNNHVVGENVREITVALPDKREIKGHVIGVDSSTDLALLKIEVRDLAAVPWGDSSQLKIGEWVLAIGSPYQLNQTVTAGIVSATGRTGLGFADYEDFIQTDAAINRGNSGGALINARGELVGINTGLFTESGGYQGIGFAVPSNLARRIVNDLKTYGEVRRGSIGRLSVEKLSEQLAQEFRAPNTNGALISRIDPHSEAYQRRPAAGRRDRRLQRSAGRRSVAVLPRRRRREGRLDGDRSASCAMGAASTSSCKSAPAPPSACGAKAAHEPYVGKAFDSRVLAESDDWQHPQRSALLTTPRNLPDVFVTRPTAVQCAMTGLPGGVTSALTRNRWPSAVTSKAWNAGRRANGLRTSGCAARRRRSRRRGRY